MVFIYAIYASGIEVLEQIFQSLKLHSLYNAKISSTTVMKSSDTYVTVAKLPSIMAGWPSLQLYCNENITGIRIHVRHNISPYSDCPE